MYFFDADAGAAYAAPAMAIQIKLREVMGRYRRRTGRRLTYASLSEMTRLSTSTLKQIGARRPYNATLATIDKLCGALECQPGELLVYSRRITHRP